MSAGTNHSRDQLITGLSALGVNVPDTAVDRLLEYLALLQKWNSVYNLTAVRQQDDMLTHHLLDSLAAVPPLLRHLASAPTPTPRLLDVGSGGGLPGVVMAICCPELRVDCIDTVGKKAAFIQQAAGSLGLTNLRGVHGRVEQHRTNSGLAYDVIASRAFASLADFVNWSRPSLADDGVWMAMKGKQPSDELANLQLQAPGVAVFHVEQLAVPGLAAERCIVWLRSQR